MLHFAFQRAFSVGAARPKTVQNQLAVGVDHFHDAHGPYIIIDPNLCLQAVF